MPIQTPFLGCKMEMSVTILQTTLAEYRLPLFALLANDFDENFAVFAGGEYFTPTVRSVEPKTTWFHPLTNWFIFQRKLCFQSGNWLLLLKCHILIAEGNPRIISTWIILVLRKLLRRKSIIWSHAFGRLGETSKNNWLRFFMFRFGDSVIVYTRTQARQLQCHLPRKRIGYAPNSILPKSKCRVHSGRATDIIYVGRLVPEKKPRLLLRGFIFALAGLPDDCILRFVGEGPEFEILKTEIAELNVAHRVVLHGHISDESILANLYADSLVAISPGYVGLSALQCMSFGVPMLVANNESHSPEIEVCRENETACFFQSDSACDLAEKLMNFFSHRKVWLDRKEEIAARIRESYTLEAMVSAFKQAIAELNNTKPNKAN